MPLLRYPFWPHVVLLLLLGDPAGTARAELLDPPRIYAQTVRATAWVRAAKDCTGWLVDREQKWLITSARGVGMEKTVRVFFPERKQEQLLAERDYYEQDAKAITGKVLARDTKRDLALIQLEALPAGTSALTLAAESPAPAERLHAVVNTSGSQALWSYATGAARLLARKNEAFQGAALEALTLVSQLPINSGDNGAAVVNDSGELVGVAVGSVDKARLVTFCVDVSEVRSFLATAKQRSERTPLAAPQWLCSTEDMEPSLFERILPATLWVSAGKVSATGILMDRPRKLAVTSLRLVGKEEAVDVWFPELRNGKVITQRGYYRNQVDPIRARVLHREPRCGVAVLELASLPETATPLKLAAAGAPTEIVYALGNPIHSTGLWGFQTGFIRQVYQRRAKLKDGDWNARTLETQTPYISGDAGAPLVNARGELLGMVDSAVPDTQLVTNCVAVSELTALLKMLEKR